MNHQAHHRHLIAPAVVFLLAAAAFTVTFAMLAILLSRGVYRPGVANGQTGFTNWRVFDGGVDDPGSNYNETGLTQQNVSGLKVLWKAALPAAADDSVVEEAAVSTPAGLQNLVFVNTIKGNLIAYNAQTGAKVWEADPSSADFNGQGTKSSPAIDPSGNYVYAYAVDGYVHKYNIATGAEVTGNGFPAQVTLLPNNIEKGSASINIANGYLYMTLSGNDGDYGHYVGHVVAINLSNGAKTVWNAECANLTELLATSGSNYCSSTMSGIWARPGVKVDPVTGNVFVVTGNGNYNANSSGNNWGDSIVELTPNLGSIVDSYTPTSYSSLDSGDADLGSTAPVILPKQSNSNTPYMMVQVGKDSIVKLINRSNLSGQGGPRHTGGEMQTITISGETHEQPAVWVDGSGNTWVYITDDAGDLYAYKLVTNGGVSSLSQVYKVGLGVSSSPFVANGVIYFAGNNIMAVNAFTGAELFSSSSLGVSLNQHWEAPVVVNDALFTPDDNGYLYALYVPGVTSLTPPTSSQTTTTSSTPTSSGGATSTAPTTTTSTAPAAKTAPSATPKPTPRPTDSARPMAAVASSNPAAKTGVSKLAAHALPTKLIVIGAAATGIVVITLLLLGAKFYALHAGSVAIGSVSASGMNLGGPPSLLRRLLQLLSGRSWPS